MTWKYGSMNRQRWGWVLPHKYVLIPTFKAPVLSKKPMASPTAPPLSTWWDQLTIAFLSFLFTLLFILAVVSVLFLSGNVGTADVVYHFLRVNWECSRLLLLSKPGCAITHVAATLEVLGTSKAVSALCYTLKTISLTLFNGFITINL